jgi:hypothetical protein
MSLEMAQKVIVPQKKNYVPQFLKQRDINSYSVLVPRPEFSGIVPFPSLELSRNFQARKIAGTQARTTDLQITKQMSYPYTTSLYT